MGTSHFFEGSITVEPALNFAEIKKAREIALKVIPNTVWNRRNATEENVFEGHMPLKPSLEIFVKDTDEGPLQVTRAAAFEPSYTSDGSYPELMQPLLEALIKGLPGHNWFGSVYSIDEYRQSAIKVIAAVAKDVSVVREVRGTAQVNWDNGDTPTSVAHIAG